MTGIGLPLLDLSPGRLMRIDACLRPFRAEGPRVEAEEIAGQRVVHAYGHGGAGWSLSWGTAEEVARLVLADRPASVAVIGAGAIGLTAAAVLAEAGITLHLYAADLPGQTRSSRATGSWSPASRVALSGLGADTAVRWEATARAAFARHAGFIGTSGGPVSLADRYLFEEEVPLSRRFAALDDRLTDIVPAARLLADADNPFPHATIRHQRLMTFDVTAYTARLTERLRDAGVPISRRRFASPREWAELGADLVVNATGFGAKALLGDETLIPIRGQTARLVAQPSAAYGIRVGHLQALSRPDGVIVQHVGGDEAGWNVLDETPDEGEFLQAVATLMARLRAAARSGPE